MRRSDAAIALIRREVEGATEWLVQWNEGWEAFSFVGGHRRSEESFRECMIRELQEELGVRDGVDGLVPTAPVLHLEYTAVSRRTGEETDYVMELFDVALVGGQALAAIAANLANRWLSEPEIMACRCRDGRLVSETPRRFLNSLGWDLFVSYAHDDDHDGWVTELLKAIRAEHAEFTSAPLRVFFDRDDIRSMDDWQRRIYDGLHASKLMLAVLSEAYFRSDYCHREWDLYRQQEARREMLGEAIAPIYIVTVQGFEAAAGGALDEWLGDLRQRADLARRQFLDIRPWRPHGVAALCELEVRRRLKQLDQQLADRLARARLVESSKSTVPRASDRFVGRQHELASLREMLPQGKVAAITAVQGIGGIGKTALAFMYAQAFADHYPGGRFLVEVSGLGDLRLALLRLVADLGLQLTEPEQRDLDLGAARVRNALEQRARLLLVLDNVDQPELLAPRNRARFLPEGERVHVLATTRLEEDRLDDAGVDCLLLESLPETDALELLNRHRAIAGDEEWKAALRIVRLLGGHALAMEVAAVYLWKHPDVFYRDYLVRLEREGVFQAMTGTGRDQSVIGQLSENPETLIGALLEPTLQSLSAAELRVLEYAALLASDSVALPWLRQLVTEEFPERFEPTPGYGDPWRETERRLYALRLLTRTDSPHLARIHRIVQAVLVGRLPAAERAARTERVSRSALERADLFASGWTGADRSWEYTPLRDYCLLGMQRDDPRAVNVIQLIAEPLQYLTSVAEAAIVLHQALRCSEWLAADDRSNAAWQRDLSVSLVFVGNVLVAQGDAAGALKAYRESLAIAQRLAAADPSNAESERDLSVSHEKVGDVLMAQGDAAGALVAHRESMEIRQRLAAADQSNVEWQRDLSVSHNRMGDVLVAQGDAAGALKAYRESLEIRQRLAAADQSNPAWQRDLSVSHERVGDVLVAQGDASVALVAYRESLEIRRRLVAADPSNAGWQRDLSVSHDREGDVLVAQREAAGALKAYRESLAIRQRLAAADPSNAAWQRNLSASCWKIAGCLEKQGDREAMDWWRRAYDVLADMSRRGLFVSPADRRVLEWLKAKVGG
jgi:predicted negative regulator of RcsB-dependent stress response